MFLVVGSNIPGIPVLAFVFESLEFVAWGVKGFSARELVEQA